MMKLTIQLFAVAREWAGRDEIELELPDDATVATVRHALCESLPPLAAVGERIAIAVNDEYANDSQPLNDNDCIAVIPPVSGG